MSALVSVFCLAYNHENYIARALDSMICQQTDFPYEIIVHDDASTDNTAKILREYEARYPDKIIGLYEKENQFFTPDLDYLEDLLLPHASGEFIAFCECDDSWEDPLKLQRQVDFLRDHPDYSMCVHAAYRHIVGTDESEDEIYPAEPEDRDYEAPEIISRGAGLFATNSFLIRREAFEHPPKCFHSDDIDDYTMLMYAATKGKLRYMHQPMSRHNDGVKGSWTQRVWNDPEKHILHQKEMIRLLTGIDEYCKGLYHDAFTAAIAAKEAEMTETEYLAAKKRGDRAELKKKKYAALVRRDRDLAFRGWVRRRFPALVALKRRLTNH